MVPSGTPQKAFFLTPKMSFSRFSNLTSVGGPWGRNGDSPRAPCDRKNSIPIENFNPCLKFSTPIEFFKRDRKFQSRVSIYGALVVYREGLDRKFQSTIDRSKFSIPKAAIEFFQSPGPLGTLGASNKNNKLNFLWPKTAGLGPRFWPQNPLKEMMWVPFLRTTTNSQKSIAIDLQFVLYSAPPIFLVQCFRCH